MRRRGPGRSSDESGRDLFAVTAWTRFSDRSSRRGQGRALQPSALGDALTEALDSFAGDPKVRIIIVTGGAPGYFNRHFSIPALIKLSEDIRASGREWPDNAAYHG